MASNNNKQGGGGGDKVASAAAPNEEIDPKYEWVENANNFLLRLTLTGFKKEDFRVQVDGKGKLTVRGQRPAGAGNKHVRFHKVFQLPSNASVDDITGRFEANVLTITVPKRPAAASPSSVQEIKQRAKQDDEDEEARKKKEDEANKKKKKLEEDVEANKKKKKKLQEEEANKKKKLEEEEEASKKKKQQQQLEEEDAMAKRGKQADEQQVHKSATERKEQQVNAAPGLSIDRDNMAERVKRRAEEERAKAAAAAEKTTTGFSGWRERVAGELEHLGDMRWAEGVVQTARRNKEVIATAVAAFSIGFFISQKLCCRR
ncbi:inactive protein RESTRICTED TEV MOVEMENT 2-like [Oryza brachyantha]|uniref:SHSP domain-containing protein n=1 Tax=Oryza brachyantha TaxID=4533 RepID=J3MAB7_ORYBR|nr:inactive protein RESTRICTED TEV MOVEMENT 2-like [Oryza brachyantha]